jgi:hypothetical protein
MYASSFSLAACQRQSEAVGTMTRQQQQQQQQQEEEEEEEEED